MKIIMFISIALLGMYTLFYLYKKFHGYKPHQEFALAAKILHEIDKNCKITKLLGTRNTIDFLNIKEFTGNTVGSIQLADPEKWKGPYLDHVPTYNNVPLVLAHTASGLYIIPGNGTILSDGSIMGNDVVIDIMTDMKNIDTQFPGLITRNKESLYVPLSLELPQPSLPTMPAEEDIIVEEMENK